MEKKNTNRIAKVNSKIEHELGPVLHEFLEGEKGLVTISKVETSRDMKWVKVWLSILAPNDPKVKDEESLDKKIFNRINSHIYEIQGELNKHFATKIVPRLQFFLDTSPRYVQHIEELVRKIHEEE